MKKLTVSLLATLTVMSLSVPSFAGNMESSRSGPVVEAPFLVARTFMTESVGVAPTSDNRQVQERGIAMENPSLTEHYGVAPAWDNRQIKDNQIKAQEERMENPSLRAISDNVE